MKTHDLLNLMEKTLDVLLEFEQPSPDTIVINPAILSRISTDIWKYPQIQKAQPKNGVPLISRLNFKNHIVTIEEDDSELFFHFTRKEVGYAYL